MKVVCIVQARIGSTRLPGKVLKDICGKTVLEHDLDRLRRVKNIDDIVIATTTSEKDIAIVKECERLKVKCFRGSEEDVLSRYYFAAKENGADVVVRITSDCPLLDSEVTESVIQCYLENSGEYDYVSNTIDRSYPRGLDTEVFNLCALEKAFNEATSQRDREHVTPYIWDNDNIFKNYQYKNETDYSDFRWTLDTEEDLKLISIIYEQFKDKDYFDMNDIVKFLDKNPEVKEINKGIEQKKIDDSLFLIPANESHCDLIYEWVNDDEVRKNSFNNNKIPYKEHVNWYLNKLKNPDCFIYLLANSNKNIGIVRVEKKENENVVSYSIEKQFRGKGYGHKILEKLQDELMKEKRNIVLTAYVKKENSYSIKIFERLNYILVNNDDNIMKFEKNLSR